MPNLDRITAPDPFSGVQPGVPGALRMHLDRLTLKFTGEHADLEAPFLVHYCLRSLTFIRFALLMGIFLISIFGVLDYYLAPHSVRLLWLVRFAVLCPGILLTLAATYWKPLVSWLPGMQIFLLLLVASGFTVMILFAQPPINYLYYSGLITVLIYGYTFLRLRFVWCTLAGWLIVGIYLLAATWRANTPVPILTNNIFFLVTSNFIGMLASYSIEYSARKNYFIMDILRATYDEMANINAQLEMRVKARTTELEEKNEKLIKEIAERKAVESALKKSERTNLAILHGIPDLVFMNHRDGENLAVHGDPDLLVAPPEAFANKNIMDILPEAVAQRLLAVFNQVLDANKMMTLTYELPIRNSQRIFEARVVPCTENTVITIVRDITRRLQEEQERLALEAQLRQSQKMESLGTLAGGVAHDMNNVLGSIICMADLGLAEPIENSRVRHAFETILRASGRAAKTVHRLLSFSRQSPAESNEVKLNEILGEQASLLEHATLRRVTIELDFSAELWPMTGDASALAHGFMNLCVNAVDAMPEGGKLKLQTRNLEPGWIEVVVEDTGTGMPKEVLEKALDPFFTTKEVGKGTGLGLPMVYSTVKAHGGRMDIESEPGKGTRVKVEFPASQGGLTVPEALGRAGSGQVQADVAGAPLNILVVDDDELFQVSVEALLESLGHEVTLVPQGEEALARIEAGLRPDAVILDMNMPGMGGAETLQRLRVLSPLLPVVLATGRADQTALDLVARHPHVTLLPKPFTSEALQLQLQFLGQV